MIVHSKKKYKSSTDHTNSRKNQNRIQDQIKHFQKRKKERIYCQK